MARDRQSGGRRCQGRNDDEVAGTFLAQSGDCLEAIRSSWTFRRQPIYRSCRTHRPPTSRILSPAVHHETHLTRRSFQKSTCLTEDLATSRAQSVRRCNPIPPPTLTWHIWTTEMKTATPMENPMEDPMAVEQTASPTSSATRLPPLKQQKQRTVPPTLSTATTSQNATLVS
jgi:hypothetical protein